jgi:hypothetical protein
VFQRLMASIATTLIMVFFDKRDNVKKVEYAFRLKLKIVEAIFGCSVFEFCLLGANVSKTNAAGSWGLEPAACWAPDRGE